MCISLGSIRRPCLFSFNRCFALSRRGRFLVCGWLGVCVLSLITGCLNTSSDARPATEVYKVQIDREENGAAHSPQSRDADPEKIQPRNLAFEVTGFGRRPYSRAPQEGRASARQAAIIDAFCKALIETRRSRGESTSNFKAKLGRLTVAHRTVGGGEEFEVRVIAQGIEKRFVVRDGVLQHLPHDFKLIHKMFEETEGKFSLLPPGPSPAPGTYVATVGCYLPVTTRERLAGGPNEIREE